MVRRDFFGTFCTFLKIVILRKSKFLVSSDSEGLGCQMMMRLRLLRRKGSSLKRVEHSLKFKVHKLASSYIAHHFDKLNYVLHFQYSMYRNIEV